MSRIRKKHAENYIDILNPHPGGAAYTQLSKATDYELAGLAVFVTATCIRFLDEEERRLNMLAERRKQSEAQESHATSGLCYEWHCGRSGGYQVMQADSGRAVASRVAQ